jgi:hypothetical protein
VSPRDFENTDNKKGRKLGSRKQKGKGESDGRKEKATWWNRTVEKSRAGRQTGIPNASSEYLKP